MKNILSILFCLVCAVTASGGSPFAFSGSSAKFKVDTRLDVSVNNVTCAYCSGAYGGQGGTRATFLPGAYLWGRFTIDDGIKPPLVDHWLVNGETAWLPEFSLNIGNLKPGDTIEVIAVGEEEQKSRPFRVNFDIAAIPDKWRVLPSGHALITATEMPNEGRVVYTASRQKFITICEGIADAFKIGDHNFHISLLPTLEYAEQFDSSTGVFYEGRGTGGKWYSNTPVSCIGRQKLANFAGISLWAEITGGNYTHWNPLEMRWDADWREGELKVTVGAKGTPLYVRFPQTLNIVYAKIDIYSEGAFAFRYVNGEWSGNIDLNPLFAIRGTLGAGLEGIACVEGFAEGGILINAIVPGNPHLIQRLGGEFKVGVRAVFIGWEREWNFVEQWWGYDATRNNTGALQSNRLLSSSDNCRFRPITRNYGDGLVPAGRRVSGRAVLLSSSGTDDTQILMHDGFPTPQPALAVVDANAVLVYVRDNAERSDLDRTELVFREEASDGSWGGETHVWDDGTADFHSKLVLLPDGTAIAAWANAKQSFADGTPFETVCASLESAVGVRDPQSGTWTCTNLTDDAALDWVPVLKGATNGTAVVAWVRNTAGAYIGTTEQPSDLAVSFYRNGSWSPMAIAVDDVGTVLSHDISWDGERAVLAWAADADGDLSTEDTEIWAKTFENGTWSSSVRLSAQSAVATRPYAWYLTNGVPHVVWVQNGALFAADGLTAASGTNVATEAELSIPNDYRISVRENGSATLLWTTDPLDSKSGLEGGVVSADYAPGAGLAASATLLKREGYLRNLSSATDANGTFRVAYESVAVSTNAEGQLVRGAVDLAVTRRDAVRDVGITADDCSFAADVDVGVTNMLLVGIQNYGTVASGTFEYRVWAGEGDDKMLLASGESNIPSLSREVVEVPWTPDEGLTNVAFTIELDVGNAIGDSRRENNTLVWRPDVGSPLLSFRNAKAVMATDTLRLISARIHNDAVAPLPAGMAVKFWRGEIGGELIGTDTAGLVSGGNAGEYDVGVAWDISGVTFTSEWERVVIEMPAEQGGRSVAVWTPTPLYDPENDIEPGGGSGGGGGGSGSGEPPSAPPNIGGITGFGVVDGSQRFNFYFYGEVGFTYLVQYKEKLTDEQWTTIETITPSTTGECPVAVPIVTSAPSGFYRVITSQ